MLPEEKLKILGTSAKYDISCCGGSNKEYIPGVYYASGSNGKIIPILKTLFTNKCKNDCLYCVNRISRDTPRVSFAPDELAALFMKIHHKHFVEGLFLSSGVDKTADKTMEQTIKTAEILRFKHCFRGFIHLKVLPGSSTATIKRAMQLATRVSVNIEAPSPKHLANIAKEKDFMREIIGAMETVKSNGISQTTQFVVGAAEETDQEIVKTMDWLHRTKGIDRTYFSTFTPIDNFVPDYNSLNLLTRKHRLYQVEFLQRLYDFDLSEIYFSKAGELPSHIDPKMNYALHNPEKFPIEINKAALYQLMRIPGIGKISAQRILSARREGRFTDLSQLKKLGAITQRASQFILIDGKKQEDPQLRLAFS